MLNALSQTLEDGGLVALILLALAVILWGVLLLRFVRIRGKVPSSNFEVFCKESWNDPVSDLYLKRFEVCALRLYLKRFEGFENVIILIAPLLGLLGTVQGMIETFDTLALSRLSPPADIMSSGISKAMLTTQMGLLVSLPGLFMHRVLKRQSKKRIHQIQLGGAAHVSKSNA